MYKINRHGWFNGAADIIGSPGEGFDTQFQVPNLEKDQTYTLS